MICSNCGTALGETDIFCPMCGTRQERPQSNKIQPEKIMPPINSDSARSENIIPAHITPQPQIPTPQQNTAPAQPQIPTPQQDNTPAQPEIPIPQQDTAPAEPQRPAPPRMPYGGDVLSAGAPPQKTVKYENKLIEDIMSLGDRPEDVLSGAELERFYAEEVSPAVFNDINKTKEKVDFGKGALALCLVVIGILAASTTVFATLYFTLISTLFSR